MLQRAIRGVTDRLSAFDAGRLPGPLAKHCRNKETIQRHEARPIGSKELEASEKTNKRENHLKIANLAVLLLLLGAAVLIGVVAAGQMGKLRGQRPADIGMRNGMLKMPSPGALNAVSSQSSDNATSIAPLVFSGDPAAAFMHLQMIISGMPRVRFVTIQPGYLHVEFETPLLKFVDDAEFILQAKSARIEMRSASRLGRRDFGVNRARLEHIREKFETRQIGGARPMV